MLPARGGVIVARRKPPPPPVIDSMEVLVPDWLRAGACAEVWVPERVGTESWQDVAVVAWTRHRNARLAFLAAHGFDARGDDTRRVPMVLRSSGTPWSYRRWMECGRLAGLLSSKGLPSDWEPTPAPWAVRSLRRDDLSQAASTLFGA